MALSAPQNCRAHLGAGPGILLGAVTVEGAGVVATPLKLEPPGELGEKELVGGLAALGWS